MFAQHKTNRAGQIAKDAQPSTSCSCCTCPCIPNSNPIRYHNHALCKWMKMLTFNGLKGPTSGMNENTTLTHRKEGQKPLTVHLLHNTFHFTYCKCNSCSIVFLPFISVFFPKRGSVLVLSFIPASCFPILYWSNSTVHTIDCEIFIGKKFPSITFNDEN